MSPIGSGASVGVGDSVSVSSSLELHGAAASSSPHSILHLPSSSLSSSSEYESGAVVYASNCIVNIATTPIFSSGSHNDISDVNDVMLYNTKKTLRTCTLPRNEWIRSITAMALLSPIHSENKKENDDEKNAANDATSAEAKTNQVSIIACAFSDGSITLWIHEKERQTWREEVVVGNTPQGSIGIIADNANEDKHGTSITDIDGVFCYSYNNAADGAMELETTIITSSAKGVHSYIHPIEIALADGGGQPPPLSMSTSSRRSVIGHYPTSSIKLTTMDNQLLLAVGTALPRNNRIHFYTRPMLKCIRSSQNNLEGDMNVNVNINDAWKHHGSVMGHLDWVSCLDWTVYEDATAKNGAGGDSPPSSSPLSASSLPTLMLASGSQDARIRLWRFHPSTLCQEDDAQMLEEDGDDEDQENDDDDDEDLIEEGEARMYIRYVNDGGNIVQSAVTLEALLIGHEEHVTSVAWRPHSSAPCVISSSMDRSILIWMEESNDDEEEEGEREDGSSEAVVSARKGHEGHGNVWVPVTRVGTAGGILGGSIGSSLLGFVNVLWTDSGRQIIGHGFGGAIYFWSRIGLIADNGEKDAVAGGDDADGNTVAASALERWRAYPGITGHFRGCHDISWEPTCGMYLLSVGADQTCRLWSRLPPLEEDGPARIWKEVGRPQVHGYDLNTVACIGTGEKGGEMLHRFVSGADEKEARAFDAPIQTIKLLQKLHGEIANNYGDGVNGKDQRVERAFIPSLGLSNRATAADAMEEGFETGVVPSSGNNDDDGAPADGDSSTDATTSGKDSATATTRPLLKMVAKSLPHERDLGVVSLWPEVRKLHGHLTEMVCLASSAGKWKGTGMDCDQHQVLVASSCKARNVEDAAIRVWDVERNMCLDILKDGHKSTVVSLSFSPDGKFLASTGKDRRLCIWKRGVDIHTSNKQAGSPGSAKLFNLSAIVESAHKRIIWSVDFCPCNANLLATGSRDGKLKIWSVTLEQDEDNSVIVKELCAFEPACKGDKKVEPITAIAFAPNTILLDSTSQEDESDNQVEHAILAMGLERGLIEIWAVPTETNKSGYSATLLHSIPLTDCHIDAVKKLAWQPLQESDAGGNNFDLTLASCSIDHGLRIYRLHFIQNNLEQ